MESFCLNFPLTHGTKRKYLYTPSNSWAKMKRVPFYYNLQVWDVNLSPNHEDFYGQARNRPEMTFWWIAKCGLDWLSLQVITWRTCQNPVRKPPTVLTVSFNGGNLSVDFTFSFQPLTKISHKFVWLVAIKTNETFSVFSVFCKSFILKLQKNNNHKNSKTGGTENEQEDAWIKKTRRIVLVSILCPILC